MSLAEIGPGLNAESVEPVSPWLEERKPPGRRVGLSQNRSCVGDRSFARTGRSVLLCDLAAAAGPLSVVETYLSGVVDNESSHRNSQSQ